MGAWGASYGMGAWGAGYGVAARPAGYRPFSYASAARSTRHSGSFSISA